MKTRTCEMCPKIMCDKSCGAKPYKNRNTVSKRYGLNYSWNEQSMLNKKAKKEK